VFDYFYFWKIKFKFSSNQVSENKKYKSYKK